MTKSFTTLCVIISVCFFFPLQAGASIADTPWPMFQHDMFHSGQSIFYGPDFNRATVTFESLVGAGVSSPVIDFDGTVYVGSTNGCFFAVSPEGDAECIFTAGGAIESTAVLSEDGVLYFGSNDGFLYAITTEGLLNWKLELGGSLTSAPAIGPNGNIYIASKIDENEGNLYCVSPVGELQWNYATGSISYSYPALDQFGMIYVGTTQGKLYALFNDGNLRWEYDLEESISSSPVITADGRVYVTSATKLNVFDFEGTLLWDFIPQGTLFGLVEDSGFAASSPVVDGEGNVYVAGLIGDMHCLNDKGEEEWSLMLKEPSLFDPLPAVVVSSPVLDRGGVIYVRSRNMLYAVQTGEQPSVKPFTILELDDEQQAAATDTTVMVEASPALGANRTLYIPCSDGSLYAVGPDELIFSISGTISGDLLEGTNVVLLGEEERVFFVEEDGRFVFPALYGGAYVVVPVQPGLKFDPPSQDVLLLFGDRNGIDFTSEGQGPSIGEAMAEPSEIPNDGISEVLFAAEVRHYKGQGAVAAVTIDLSPIGGSARQRMSDDGSNGDAVAGDGMYSYRTTIDPAVSIGPKGLLVTSTDTDGFDSFSVITVEIVSNIVGTRPEVFEVSNEIEGHRLVIIYRSDSGDVFTCGVFAPSDPTTPHVELILTSTEMRYEIENAEVGTWTYKIVSGGSSPKEGALTPGFQTASAGQYKVSTSAAGTGVVFGSVIDADTGAPVNVTVSTSIGGSTVTQNGYYMLLSPAGAFTLMASSAGYAPASRSVSLLSGSSVEANIVMYAGGGGGDTCILDSLFAGNTALLDGMRSFRDTVLAGSATGRACIDLYYRYSPEIEELLDTQKGLRRYIRQSVLEVFSGVHMIPASQDLQLDDMMLISLQDVFSTVQNSVSEDLRRAYEALMQRLEGR